MDVLKFAFEIMIVGTLALPWVAVLIHIFAPGAAADKPIDSFQFFLSVVPEHTKDAVGVVVMIALAYLLGSAVSRVSRNFFNDDLLGRVPTENQIRRTVYRNEYCESKLLRYRTLPQLFKSHPGDGIWMCAETNNGKDKTFDGLVEEMFSLQEGALLLNGQDKIGRLKEYYDQITVLRGATWNGIILSALCAFGLLGNFRGRYSGRRVLRVLVFLPAVIATLYGGWSFWSHWRVKASTRYIDPPLAEILIVLIGLVGLWVIYKANYKQFYLPAFAVGAILTVISFGGWWWTEVMYDLYVIHSIPQLPQGARESASNAYTPAVLAPRSYVRWRERNRAIIASTSVRDLV